jgi:iron complex transport system ATP-binding protein
MTTLLTCSLSYSVDEKYLIKDITLEFASGCLHAILGPNGSGKSTFLKTMAGILKPSSGTVLWNAEALLEKDRQFISRTISFVPQTPKPQFDFIVEDVVAMGRYSHGNPYWNAADKPLIEEALIAVDALHLRSRRVTCLSQGERQRVYIARALATESPVLLMDEPMTSLDIRHQLEIWQLLKRLVDNGKVVIITTHDLAIAEHYCGHIAVLNQGRCIGFGSFSELMTKSLLRHVFGVTETESYPLRRYSL